MNQYLFELGKHKFFIELSKNFFLSYDDLYCFVRDRVLECISVAELGGQSMSETILACITDKIAKKHVK
jgi:hypothetical protein